MIAVNNLSVQFSGNYLFDHVSFMVNPRERIGLTGKNGAGKSTLLKILAKQQEPESGSIVVSDGDSIGYLPQEMIPDSNFSIIDEAMKAFEEVGSLEKKIEEITTELSHREDYESDEYQDLIHRLSDANERFLLIGGQNREAQTERVLLGLGFTHADFQRKMTEFSSGWQMRVELAKILLKNPEIMLLDEPTNHLDIESIQWLEGFLQHYEGSIILVSHDRAFLDHVTNRTIEITMGRIEDYKVSYSEYVEQRAERRQSQMNAYENQQKEIADIERFIERFRYKSSKAKQAQSRIKMLDKMDKIEVDEFDQSRIHFRFPPAPHSGKVMVETQNLKKAYDQKLVLENVNFQLIRGEKIAFVGKNGEGKSTLSKIIIGELPFEGSCEIGHQVKVGYFAQNQAALLDGEKTVFQTIDDIATGEIRTKIRNILGSFLFGGEDIDKKVKVLSGGEKTRLALAKLLLSPVNLLVLDEPTNHLDMVSKDILKNALMLYDGAMILVSHDRDFLQGLTSKVYEFKNRQIKMHIGDIYEFLEKRKIDDLAELNAANIERKNSDVSVASNQKMERELKKKQESEQRKLKTQVEKIEQEIEILEKEKASMDQLLSNPDNISSSQVFIDYNKLKDKLDKKISEWEKLLTQLEE